MKLRCYPKTAVLLGLLDGAIDGVKAQTALTEGKLDKLVNNTLLYKPDTDLDRSRFQSDIAMLRERRYQLENYRMILESHAPPEVMVEIDDDLTS